MKAKVEGIEVFSENSFVLKLKPSGKFDYRAGQFVMLKAGECEKPFSISSHPSEKFLEFLIREHNDGSVTPKLMHLKKGDVVEVEGPFGAFGVRESKAKEILFVAAGTGVAPFRAMVQDALLRFPNKKITLLFGFRFDFYYEKIWKSLQKKYKNFNLVACCSKPGKEWKGKSGRVTDFLGEVLKPSMEIYICGQEKMVEDVKVQLTGKLGVDAKRVHVEEWKEEKVAAAAR
jgi:NAD(P)H-flavin reductase